MVVRSGRVTRERLMQLPPARSIHKRFLFVKSQIRQCHQNVRPLQVGVAISRTPKPRSSL